MSSTKRRFTVLCGLVLCLILMSIFLDRDQVGKTTQQEALAKQRYLMTPPKGAHLTGITLVNRAGSFELLRDPAPTGRWRLIRPLRFDAEETTVEALLQQVLELQSLGVVGVDPNSVETEVIDSAQNIHLDANQFGFTSVPRAICLKYAADNSTEVTDFCLETGDVNNFDQTLFARRRGDATLHRVDKSLANALEADLYTLRDKRLVPIAPEQIVELSVAHQSKLLYKLVRGPKAFLLDEPGGARADPVIMGSILSALTQMRGAQFFDDPNNPVSTEPMGLNPPALTVQVRDKDGRLFKLSLGRVVLKGEAHIFARLEEPPGVAASLPSDYAFNQLNRGRPDLREKRLLPDLQKEAVASIVITEPGGRFTLLQASDSNTSGSAPRWQLRAEKEEIRADEEAVAAFIAACRALQSEQILKEPAGPSDLRAYQLDKQKREIVLLDKDGQSLGALYFGKEIEPDLIALTTDTRTRIDAITSQMGRILMSPPETFRADHRAALTP